MELAYEGSFPAVQPFLPLEAAERIEAMLVKERDRLLRVTAHTLLGDHFGDHSDDVERAIEAAQEYRAVLGALGFMRRGIERFNQGRAWEVEDKERAERCAPIVALLDELGDEPDAIAQNLATLGIKGDKTRDGCPIAVYLNSVAPRDTEWADDGHSAYVPFGNESVDLPKPIRKFEKRFAAGTYPELEGTVDACVTV